VILSVWRAELEHKGWGNWAVEIGYRLAREFWGKGFATQGARAALGVGFERLGLERTVAVTSRLNLRSQAVMKRIGRHCLYTIEREQWTITRET
jgi:RimJ/RimL family protein N-acetyltransferase